MRSLQGLLVDCRKGVAFIRAAGIYDKVLALVASGSDDKPIDAPKAGKLHEVITAAQASGESFT